MFTKKPIYSDNIGQEVSSGDILYYDETESDGYYKQIHAIVDVDDILCGLTIWSMDVRNGIIENTFGNPDSICDLYYYQSEPGTGVLFDTVVIGNLVNNIDKLSREFAVKAFNDEVCVHCGR